jgi:Pentapeptide repeats (8 copies)
MVCLLHEHSIPNPGGKLSLFVAGLLVLNAQVLTMAQAPDNQREAVLQTYLDKMTELLLEKNLRKSQREDEVRKIAHIRTLAVLPSLDIRRKGIVLQFLYESDLINQNTPIIPLSGADLSGADLSGTFHKAFPWAVYQDIVDIPWENPTAQYGADLSGANLWGAILNGANLSRANLHDANLRGADLRDADLSDADLSDADLSDANLMNATITQEQRETAKSLKGAIMPDQSIHS